MLSPSQGFCYCLPVRLGALVVSILACIGSAILAGITFNSLAKTSASITPTQAAGFYLTSLSWTSLALFSLIGFISVILQHPLLLTIFSRFIIYHLPANLLCNLFFTIVLFNFYRTADTISRSSQCTRGKTDVGFCAVSAALETMTWLYLWVLIPAVIAQMYVYVIIRRFMFVVSGQWALEKEHALEIQKKFHEKPQTRKRGDTITHSIGHRGRRRAKAELWFTMETSSSETPPPRSPPEESFLPNMALSPMAFRSPQWSPFSNASRGLPGSPRPMRNATASPGMEQSSSRGSPRPLPATKEVTSDMLVRRELDFSDPGPMGPFPRHAEVPEPSSGVPLLFRQEKLAQVKRGESTKSDGTAYSGDSTRAVGGISRAPTSKFERT